MKKTVTLLLAAALLLAMLTGCGSPADNSADLTRLQEQLSALEQRVAQLEQQLQTLETGAVSDWSLTGTPLTQGSGATVTLSVTPTRYTEGQMALLRVMLGGQVTAELYCSWDGTAYSASVELDAADGYSYYLILTEPEGTQEHLDLNSPMNPVDPTLVYMDSSLRASCMLNLYECSADGDALTLQAAAVQIQLPQLTAGGAPAVCTEAAIVLQLDGAEVQRTALTVPQDGTNPLILDASGIRFPLPSMEEDSQLDLWLEVTLSDGQLLTHFASSWYFADGQLIQAVG